MSGNAKQRVTLTNLTEPQQMRELNRQMTWIWDQLLGGLSMKSLNSGTRKVIEDKASRSEISQTADQIRMEVENQIDGVNTAITQTAEKIDLKADKATVNELGNEVENLESEFSVMAGEIGSKVSRTEFDELGNAVSKNSSAITQTAKEIRAEVADEIEGVNSTISQTAKEIRSEVSDTEAELRSEISQTADEINLSVSNIRVGGTQLIRRSRTLPTDTSLAAADRWRLDSGVSDYANADGFSRLKFYGTGETEVSYKNAYSPVSRLPAGWQGQEVTLSAYVYSPNWAAVDSNVRCAVRLSQGGTSVLNYGARTLISAGGVIHAEANETGTLTNKKWTRISATFPLTVEELSSGTGVFEDNTHVYVSFSLWKNGDVRLYAPKLEMGNKATDWSPAPDDTDAEFEDVRSEIALTKDQITLAVEGVQVGGRNYFKNSGIAVSNAKYSIANYTLGSITPQAGEEFTLRIWGSLGSDRTGFIAHNTNAYVYLGALKDNGDGTYSLTFKWNNEHGTYPVTTPTSVRIYQKPNTGTSTSTITRIKLEKGNKATDWTPAPEDPVESLKAGTNVTITKDEFRVTTPEFNVNITSEDGTENMLHIDKDGMYANSFESPTVVPRYNGPTTLYVNSAATSTQIAAGNYFRSIADAIGALNYKWIEKTVTVNIAAGHEEIGTITMRGIHGGDWINIYGESSDHALLRGRLNIHYCAAPIRVKYIDIVSTGVGIQLGGRMTMAQITNCIVTGPGTGTSDSYGIHATNGAYGRLSDLEIYDFSRSVYGQLSGTITASSCKGNCTVGANRTSIYLSGSMPCASTAWTALSYAGQVLTSDISVDQGSKPTTPTVTTTTVTYSMTNADNYTHANGSWTNYSDEDIRQGYTSANGMHRGCFWFDNTTIRSALKGKTIKQATLSLYQMSAGRSQSVQVSLEGITMNYSGRTGVPYGTQEYGVIGTTAGVNQTTTFTIPTKVITDLVAGTINGLMLRNDENSVMTGDDNSYHFARFAGGTTTAHKPVLTVTYA